MDALDARMRDARTWDRAALRERVDQLGQGNGLRMVLVDDLAGAAPSSARLVVHFHTDHQLPEILGALLADPERARRVFEISGGRRIPAGPLRGQVHVTSVEAGPDARSLVLAVRPVGDYTTYHLRAAWPNIDPLLDTIPFRFRPGCFSGECDPAATDVDVLEPDPVIDYLARDFDSFKHLLITAMMERVPGWRPTSEADLDETLIELISARADELADFQDRVLNEAWIATARRRVSVARHARLMDYHLDQGSQASTWLALTVGGGVSHRHVDPGIEVATVPSADLPSAWDVPTEAELERARTVFRTTDGGYLDSLLDEIRVHGWNGVKPTLPRRSVEADLRLAGGTQADAERICSRIREGTITTLILEEQRDPETCRRAGLDRAKRQLLTLRPETARTLYDPLHRDLDGAGVTGAWLLHVAWREPLAADYCIVSACQDGDRDPVDDVSVLRGNVLRAVHGRQVEAIFVPPDAFIDPFADTAERTHRYQPADRDATGTPRPFGVQLELPVEEGPLLYRPTTGGGTAVPCSTLHVQVAAPGSPAETWRECISLVHSRPGDPHFVVEVDEHGASVVRFGAGRNGRGLPEGATVTCTWSVGNPLDGNVGADSLAVVRAAPPALASAGVRNPFDVRNGRAPEPIAEAIRRAPEAFRARQLRAVTLADYVRRAEEVAGVARAAAQYAWTGSWRTVRVTVDPAGSEVLDPALRARVAAHLDAVRLIGEDLEIRGPRFVPLDIEVVVCVTADHWVEDVRAELRDAFTDGVDRWGAPAFFHPDRWTFGQQLHASQVISRVERIEGVDHVEAVRMKRFDAPTPATDAIAVVRPNEILRVRNDPDRREDGSITFRLTGGRA